MAGADLFVSRWGAAIHFGGGLSLFPAACNEVVGEVTECSRYFHVSPQSSYAPGAALAPVPALHF